MIDLFQARRESHEARELGHEFKIQEGGVSLEVPRVEGQAFYPSGDAPRMTRDGTPMENIKEGLADLPKAVGSAGAGLAAGAVGLPGDLVSLIGGLGSALFPGDQSRLEAFTTTMTDISEAIGSERFLGLYTDIVNNAGFSEEDKKMMLDVAEGASFFSIPGAATVAKGSSDAIRSGVVRAGRAAQARLDEAAGSTTLTSGVDVGKGIDQAIAAAGRQFADAQVRYFETGKFEPPTAENPVSVVKPTETEPGIIAFHGSGADFDEFRLEMIGTGEGAQAYGYGLYFTDSEDIAKFYRNAMVDRDRGLGIVRIKYKGESFAEFEDSAAAEADPIKYRMLAALGRQIERPVTMRPMDDPEKVAQVAKDELLQSIDRNIEMQRKAFANESASVQATMEDTLLADIIAERDALARIDPADIEVDAPTGKIYKVGLSPKPDELLDYDLPLNQQPRVVQKLIENLVGDLLVGEPEVYDRFDFKALAAIKGESPTEGYSPTGDDILTDLERFFAATSQEYGRIRADGAVKASQLLNDFGIPGIKYRAAGSRGAGVTDEAAERNYVIFDDKAVKILEKYGIVGPVAITAAAAGQSNDNEDGGI